MRPHRLFRVLTIAWITLLPAAAGATVSDWYGTWQLTYVGDSSGTCAATIGAANASLAIASMNCSSSVGGPPFSSSGFVMADGEIYMTGTVSSGGNGVQTVFFGMLQGDSGQGQWIITTVDPTGTVPTIGTWTTTHTQRVAINPDQPVAPPPPTQTDYTASAGQLPEAALNALATGTLGRASLNVTLDLSRIPLGLSFGAQGQFAAGYNIYVAALVPAGVLSLPAATWFMLRPTPNGWAMLASPIAAYLQGVSQGAASLLVQVSILENMDLTALLGSEIYVGYGLDSDEMLARGRYRGVYIVR